MRISRCEYRVGLYPPNCSCRRVRRPRDLCQCFFIQKYVIVFNAIRCGHAVHWSRLGADRSRTSLLGSHLCAPMLTSCESQTSCQHSLCCCFLTVPLSSFLLLFASPSSGGDRPSSHCTHTVPVTSGRKLVHPAAQLAPNPPPGRHGRQTTLVGFPASFVHVWGNPVWLLHRESTLVSHYTLYVLRLPCLCRLFHPCSSPMPVRS